MSKDQSKDSSKMNISIFSCQVHDIDNKTTKYIYNTVYVHASKEELPPSLLFHILYIHKDVIHNLLLLSQKCKKRILKLIKSISIN